MSIDIYKLRTLAENAVNCQTMCVGVENLNVADYKIAIVENGKNVAEIRLNSYAAKKLFLEAMKTQRENDEEQIEKIAKGQKSDEPKFEPKPIVNDNIPF